MFAMKRRVYQRLRVHLPVSSPLLRLSTHDLVDGSVADGDDEQTSTRTRLDVGDDAEVGADQEALALRHVVERDVVSDPVAESRVVHRDLPSVAGEVEPE